MAQADSDSEGLGTLAAVLAISQCSHGKSRRRMTAIKAWAT